MKVWAKLSQQRSHSCPHHFGLAGIAVVLMVTVSGCVTAKYGNPFLNISYTEKANIDSDDFAHLFERFQQSSQQQEIDRLFTDSLLDGRYLPIVASTSGTIQFAFDTRMIGWKVKDIFSTGSRLWERRLVEMYSMGYVPFKFTQGYFWVHLIVEPLGKDTLLLQMEPQGERMYGYSNPMF